MQFIPGLAARSRKSPELVLGDFSLHSMTIRLKTDNVELVHQPLARIQPATALSPLVLGQGFRALTYTISKSREVATSGDLKAADTQALLNVVRSGYRPFQVVALGAPKGQSTVVPLLQIEVS